MASRGRVALLPHPHLPAAQALARALVDVVRAAGFEPVLSDMWDERTLERDGCGCELVVTLGGDGANLRVARATLVGEPGARRTPPILAIDFGTLGFLTEVPPQSAVESLAALLAGGEHWIEERRLLRAELERDGEIIASLEALNDVVLARGDGTHAVRLRLEVDGAECVTYSADALIVASPTGSTAYTLAAGGMILPPEMDAMIAMPVAPHLAVTRGLVLPGASRVTMIGTSYHPKVMTVDGQINLDYENGDRVFVSQSDSVARFVRLGPRDYFYRTLQQKLRRR